MSARTAAAEIPGAEELPAGAGWSAPLEFDADLAGPPCPVDALPLAIRSHVQESAASAQIPPCMAAAVGLSVLAAAAARRARVAIGRTHTEPLNLYVGSIAAPGERKSFALRNGLEPLDAAQRELTEEMKDAVRENRQQRAVAEQRIQRLRAEAAKAASREERTQLIREASEEERETPTEIFSPRLYLDDATPEALVRTLAEQGGRIALMSEEGGTLIGVSAGRYERTGAPNVDALLKGYDGGSIRVDRVSRDPVEVTDPALTIAVMLQPAMLDRMAEVPDLRGRGLLGRFMWVWPESRVGSRLYQDRPISATARAGYGACIRRIHALDAPADASKALTLQLEGGALETWSTYADGLETGQRDGGELETVRDWASKHAGRAARLAGLFHLCRYAGGSIPSAIAVEDMRAAIRIAQWLEMHAKAVFARMGTDPETVTAKRILRWLRERQRSHFTLRDVHRLFGGARLPEDYWPALRVLEAREFIRETVPEPSADPRGRGRKKAASFAVNPLTHDTIAVIDRNGLARSDSGNCGNSVSGKPSVGRLARRGPAAEPDWLREEQELGRVPASTEELPL